MVATRTLRACLQFTSPPVLPPRRRFVRLAGGDKRICEYNQARRTSREAPRAL